MIRKDLKPFDWITFLSIIIIIIIGISVLSYAFILIGLLIGNNALIIKTLLLFIPSTLLTIMIFIILHCVCEV